MESSKNLKRSFLIAVLSLLIAFAAAGTATFAWYLYHAGSRTTEVRMAAGTTTSLEIANEYDGHYGSSTRLESFAGYLNPVSTNNILSRERFRKVFGFTNGAENHLVATWFGSADWSDYYKTTLFLRAKGGQLDVYVSGITYNDSNLRKPISSAIRVGLVVHDPGAASAERQQYIFAINPDAHTENPDYNTYTGRDGFVLDLNSADTEALTEFTPYTPANYCRYDKDTGLVTLLDQSVRICTLPNDGVSPAGEPVQVDVYIWLEGCDSDCTDELALTTLENVALSFAGVAP